MKFGLALENMNTGKKVTIPGHTGICMLLRDEQGKPEKILADGKTAKLTHADLLSENWEIV